MNALLSPTTRTPCKIGVPRLLALVSISMTNQPAILDFQLNLYWDN